jgi:hypothetical protein
MATKIDGISLPRPVSSSLRPDASFSEDYQRYLRAQDLWKSTSRRLTLEEYAQFGRKVFLPLATLVTRWQARNPGYSSDKIGVINDTAEKALRNRVADIVSRG